jgi:hypothetical protein
MMSKVEELTATFLAMQGEPRCAIHDIETLNSGDGISKHCPHCLGETERENAEWVLRMNESIRFADWQSKTDE